MGAHESSMDMGSTWVVAWIHNGLVWAPGATTQWPHGPNWPTRASMQQLGAIGCPIGGPGLALGRPSPPPCSQIQWAPQLVAPNGLATLMAMAQDCAHGLCTPHTMHSVPLGTWVGAEIEKLFMENRGIPADF